MTHASVFSGIGGPDVAAAMLGWENLFHCEINPFGRAVLQYWFPNAKSYEDITTTDFSEWGAGSTSSREASLASHSVMPGSDEARMMTATSGRLCTAALTKSDPIGLCVRMLLESPRWSSRATLLKWRLKKAYSVRLTHFTDTDSTRPLPLNASAKTLKTTDMPSKRLLFQLVPLTRRTDETECSSLDTVLLQTPRMVETDETPESFARRKEKNGYRNGTKFGSLTSQIKYDPRVQTMLKTPCAANSYTDNMESQGVSGTSGTLAQEIVSGYAEKHRGLILPTPRSCTSMAASLETDLMTADNRNPNLEVVIARQLKEGLLPTPTYIEGVKWTNTWNPNSQMGQSLSAMAGSGMLPTPAARDHKQDIVDEKLANRAETHQVGMPEVIATLQVSVDGTPSRLNPLFTEEMMGFPFLWTTLPFLRQNGEPNHSKPTATP